jgi:hypothetical protein
VLLVQQQVQLVQELLELLVQCLDIYQQRQLLDCQK